jgi:hypothetical protein
MAFASSPAARETLAESSGLVGSPTKTAVRER